MIVFKQLNIKNYRSCISTLVEFHPELTALIGMNGAGKTNILNAMLAPGQALHTRTFSAKKPKNDDYRSRFELLVEVDGREIRIKANVYIEPGQSPDDIVYSTVEAKTDELDWFQISDYMLYLIND